MFKQLWFLTILIGIQLQAAAQDQLRDSTAGDSSQLTDQLMIQQQQTRLDSLIRIRLHHELSQLKEDNKRRREVEEQLRQLTVADSIRNAQKLQRIRLLRATTHGSPVTLLGDTLFYVYTRIGSFNTTERAQAITHRIRQLYDDNFFHPDSLQTATNETTIDIVYKKDHVIVSVTDMDALFAEKPQQELAQTLLTTIRRSVQEQQAANSISNWLRRLGLVALIVLGILLLVWIINKLFRALSQKLVAKKDKYFKGVHLKSFKLFTPRQHLNFALRMLGIIKLTVIVLAFYFSLPLLFSIFPQTEDYTITLINWIWNPARSVLLGILHYLPKLFTIFVIYLFTRYATMGIRHIANGIQKGNMQIRGFYSDWAYPTFNIIRFLLYALMLVLIFPYLPGSDSPAFQGVSVFLGILFSLGSSSAIGNIVAGLVITYMRPFRVGDRVKIGEITGDVIEKTLLVTRIRTIKNEEITVPNASVLSNHTTNYTAGALNQGLIIYTTVTIGYDVPWKKVQEALIRAATKTPLIEPTPPPFVLQTSLDDYYVSYQINAYTKHPAQQAQIYSDLHLQILDACFEAGIEIMSPHYQANRDGTATAIPPEYNGPNKQAH